MGINLPVPTHFCEFTDCHVPFGSQAYNLTSNYLRDGNALSLQIPSAMQAEQYYKRLLLSQTVTEAWV